MRLHKSKIAREGLYLVLFIAVGVACAPWYGTVRTHTAFDKYWNDLIRDRYFFTWLKILLPYFAFEFVRSIAWSVRTLRTKNESLAFHKRAMAREWLYFLLFVALGVACTPLLFYSTTTLVSIWDDTTYTVTAFEKYWEDLVRYHEVAKVGLKILMPYFVFLFVRTLLLTVGAFRKDRGRTIQK